MVIAKLNIREIEKNEYHFLGKLMVDVYSQLEGFPSPIEQPDYYQMLQNIGSFNEQDNTKVLIAETANNKIVGAVVYYDDMAMYGSGGIATQQKQASGIRLLCVAPNSRGMGVGLALTNACIKLATVSDNNQIILHTTKAMMIAWKMYTKLGFKRAIELDFSQGDLCVYGFRLSLTADQS